jgi:hydrogenase maturation protein HypF
MSIGNNNLKSFVITVKGLVQGVGFRPFIYRIANEMGLTGSVENNNEGVTINVQADYNEINYFADRIKKEKPLASHIDNLEVKEISSINYSDFRIVKSSDHSDEITEISPDIAVCDNCLADLKTQKHRLDYPFINCTNCGPRYTIIKDLPYDRDKTTMKDFVMCDTCHYEYTNILDRRFHAQPVACNNCGPVYELYYKNERFTEFEKVVINVASVIDEGLVLAMKGLGGFHLSCDALNDVAVKRLRKLKNRESKPLAVMFRDMETVRKYAEINDAEERSLMSWRRPIVLLKEKKSCTIPASVSNGLGTIGVILPYIPFHYLLFEHLKTQAIVLTSGNISDEPIVIDNDEAKERLSGIFDALLVYNRDIYNRTDDSVVFVANGKERIIRRSRGYVPNPVQLGFNAEGIFAAGAELKNCFCIGKENHAILSQHIGDLKNIETYWFYKNTIEQFKKLFRAKTSLAVGDLHPDYLSTRYVHEMNIPEIFVQHHHAHIASCMAEHHLDEKIIGVSFDGTGYGDDGNIWGGEFFVCDLNDCERISHFEYIPVPGGDKVSGEPWRMAVSYLYKVYGKEFLNLDLSFLKDIPKEKINLLLQAIDKKLNCPLTSSAGRLFDAVAAITGICTYNGFEAEAPMRLESAIGKDCEKSYNYTVNETVCFEKTINGIVNDVMNNVELSVIAAKFHNTLITAIIEVVSFARSKYNLNKVVLSGGVFQNRYLLENAENILTKNHFEVYTHCKVPSNDGGIALGQLAIGAKRKL